MASPTLLIRPVRSISPDWYFFGVRPKWAPTAFDLAKRSGRSMAERKVMATTGPTPGTVISRPHTSSSRTAASSSPMQASAYSAAQRRSCPEQRLGDPLERGLAGHELADAGFELALAHRAHLQPEAAQDATDTALDVAQLGHQQLARGQQGADLLGLSVLT